MIPGEVYVGGILLIGVVIVLLLSLAAPQEQRARLLKRAVGLFVIMVISIAVLFVLMMLNRRQ